MKAHKGSIITYPTGERFWPLEPDLAKIHAVDIAHSLSNICRYAGHVNKFYSVAEHSCRVYQLVSKENKPHAILHDASETYTSDLVAPLKYLPEFKKFRDIEANLEYAICLRFGLSPVLPKEVDIIDKHLRQNEMRDLKGITPKKNGRALIDMTISPWTPARAEKEFLKCLAKEGLI